MRGMKAGHTKPMALAERAIGVVVLQGCRQVLLFFGDELQALEDRQSLINE